MSLMQHKIAFIGGGNMCRNLVSGLLENHVSAKNLWVTGRSQSKLIFYQDVLKVNTTLDNNEAVSQADIIILCVKPAQMHAVCLQIKKQVLAKSCLVVSIATGVTLPAFLNWFDAAAAIARAMPNTASALGVGMTGLIKNTNVSQEQAQCVESIFRAVGAISWFDNDSQMNKVTALSGSGPAYIYFFMEALEDAAVEAGLSVDEAGYLVKNMVLGAARMAFESRCDVVELRREVTSPGGATEQAINYFKEHGFREMIATAYERACKRAEEIADKASTL